MSTKLLQNRGLSSVLASRCRYVSNYYFIHAFISIFDLKMTDLLLSNQNISKSHLFLNILTALGGQLYKWVLQMLFWELQRLLRETLTQKRSILVSVRNKLHLFAMLQNCCICVNDTIYFHHVFLCAFIQTLSAYYLTALMFDVLEFSFMMFMRIS